MREYQQAAQAAEERATQRRRQVLLQGVMHRVDAGDRDWSRRRHRCVSIGRRRLNARSAQRRRLQSVMHRVRRRPETEQAEHRCVSISRRHRRRRRATRAGGGECCCRACASSAALATERLSRRSTGA